MLFINIIQIIAAILMIVAILLQSKGSGLGAAFGDNSNIVHTRRGAEKFLFYFTIVMAVVFLGTAFLNMLLA